uniref:Vesicle transport protein n=1 Tax=Globodera pallida TaxID=36090 RepID=A0A183CPC1_GLOPA
MERLMEQFHLTLHSFIESIKAKASASSSIIVWAHRENGFNDQQHPQAQQQQQQRLKRMNTFDGIEQGGGGGAGGGEASTHIHPLLCILFGLLAMASFVGLMVGLSEHSPFHDFVKFALIFISLVVLVFSLLMCKMCYF